MRVLGWKGAGVAVQQYLEYCDSVKGLPKEIARYTPSRLGQEFTTVCGIVMEGTGSELLLKVERDDTEKTLKDTYDLYRNASGVRWYKLKDAVILDLKPRLQAKKAIETAKASADFIHS